jgi:hypothetical protein
MSSLAVHVPSTLLSADSRTDAAAAERSLLNLPASDSAAASPPDAPAPRKLSAGSVGSGSGGGAPGKGDREAARDREIKTPTNHNARTISAYTGSRSGRKGETIVACVLALAR